MSKVLASNKSGITKVFRRIVSQLQKDPEFSRLFGSNIRSWDGSQHDKAPFAPSNSKPVVRLTPAPGNQDWQSPDSQLGTLTIVVEMAIATLCIDDVIDAWDVLVTALSPFQMEFVRELKEVGAETGEIVFSDPSLVPQPEADPQGLFLATGRFRLRYVRMVNPVRSPDTNL